MTVGDGERDGARRRRGAARLSVVSGCGGPGAGVDARREPSSAGLERAAGSEPVRRLRVAPAVELELVPEREGPRPEVVWASLPERAREAVLALLARLIDAGAVEREGEV